MIITFHTFLNKCGYGNIETFNDERQQTKNRHNNINN